MADLINYNKISPPPDRVVCFYKQYQKLYDNLLREGFPVTFVEGLPDDISQANYFDKRYINLCVTDDLHLEEKTGKHVPQLLCNGARHSNTAVVYLTQNLLFKQSFEGDIRLNASHCRLQESTRTNAVTAFVTSNLSTKTIVLFGCFERLF